MGDGVLLYLSSSPHPLEQCMNQEIPEEERSTSDRSQSRLPSTMNECGREVAALRVGPADDSLQHKHTRPLTLVCNS